MPKKKHQDDLAVLRLKLDEINKVILAVERWIDHIWGTVFTWYATYEPGSADQFLRAFKAELANALRVRYTSSLVDDDVRACKGELGKSHDVTLSNQSEKVSGAFQVVEQVKGDDARLAEALLDLGVATIAILDLGIAPARKVRDNLMAELRLVQPMTQRRGRRGRPPDPQIAMRDQRMLEAWETGRYRTYKELGKAFRVNEDAARKAVQRAKRRRKR